MGNFKGLQFYISRVINNNANRVLKHAGRQRTIWDKIPAKSVKFAKGRCCIKGALLCPQKALADAGVPALYLKNGVVN